MVNINMRKQTLILLTLTLFIIYSCNNYSSNKDIIETWDNGHSKRDIVWTNKQDSTYIETTYFENGQIKLEKIVANARLEKLTGYYENGELAGIVIYSNNKIISAAEYYENGQIKGDVPRSVNGKINGQIKYYYENGRVSEEGFSINDKRHGIWKKYDKDGNLILERIFDDGKQIDTENN